MPFRGKGNSFIPSRVNLNPGLNGTNLCHSIQVKSPHLPSRVVSTRVGQPDSWQWVWAVGGSASDICVLASDHLRCMGPRHHFPQILSGVCQDSAELLQKGSNSDRPPETSSLPRHHSSSQDPGNRVCTQRKARECFPHSSWYPRRKVGQGSSWTWNGSTCSYHPSSGWRQIGLYSPGWAQWTCPRHTYT